MKNEFAILKVNTDTLDAFVYCLVLGTLRAMRQGSIPLEAGVWTMARPVFSSCPDITKRLPKDLTVIMQSADELEALASLCGREAADRKLDDWITFIEEQLSQPEECMWHAKWSGINTEHVDPPSLNV